MNGIEFPDDMLSKMWDEFDWKKARNKVFKLQQLLTIAAFKHRDNEVKKLSNEIVNSLGAKALAVKKVSEELDSAPGIDKVKWIKSADKMRAAFALNRDDYKSKPYKRFVIHDNKSNKERRINIPTMFDRAMQVLYSMVLDPISEATADRKSFAFRKGRSALDVHALIMHMLKERNAPEWFLICDIKSYYDTISHDWLLRNIPMNKNVLKEFIKAGIVFNNEIFPNDMGISLGSNISTIIGNMTLDGIQKLMYDQQDSENIDYWDGYTIRFADDILISARTKEKAQHYLECMKQFAAERGLELSPTKTHIEHLSTGFEFLSRRYYKKDFQIHCVPSKNSITKMENELYDLILNNDKRWSQKKLIQALNAKLNGWASYHRITEAGEAFNHIDVVVSALLLNLTKQMYPKKPLKTIIKKYWYKDEKQRDVFTLTTNKNIRVIKLEDIVLVEHPRIDIKQNIYLDVEYFQSRCNTQEMIKISGKYKSIWQRQEGKCYYCGKKIKTDQHRKIIFKNLNQGNTLSNMAYIHSFCEYDEIKFVNSDYSNLNKIDVETIIKEIKDPEIAKVYYNRSKYSNLYEYFATCTKYTFILTFKEIENIIDEKLCNSLYKYESYWYQNKKGLISKCWLENGYVIKRLYLKEKKVTFIRKKKQSSRIDIPKQLLSSKIPQSAKYELEQFFNYIIDKYGL
ncbi:MAG: reverse transcriptase N-terminal domain-containing protein [Bacilli bacterium]|nr:reverse transcriptase N-terminal domain-containing protein [Bacilli bacterium]